MTTTRPAALTSRGGSGPPRPEAPGSSSLEPGRRLSPSPRSDGPWRLLLTLLGGGVVVLLLLAMGTVSMSSWLAARSYTVVPATTELGTPDSLGLTSDLGDIHVEHSDQVDQVTLALVENGKTELPAEGEEARARIDLRGDAESSLVDVDQPDGPSAIPWEDQYRNLVLLIPAGHDLTLEITSRTGDVDTDGAYSALSVATETGNVHLDSVSAPGGLTVTSDVGDVEVEVAAPMPEAVEVTTSVGNVDLLLPEDAGGDVTARSEVGDIDVTAPGATQWSVTARTAIGEQSVDSSLTADASTTEDSVGRLTAISEMGNVTISR